MPLLQIHYSSNLDGPIAVRELVRALHAAALGTGQIPKGGLRTMAHRHDDYEIADGDPENAFVHVVARLKGRDPDTMGAIGDTLFKALSGFMDGQYRSRPLSLSLELVEIETWKRNNIHGRLDRA